MVGSLRGGARLFVPGGRRAPRSRGCLQGPQAVCAGRKGAPAAQGGKGAGGNCRSPGRVPHERMAGSERGLKIAEEMGVSRASAYGMVA
jgi:hypothetical protein